MRNIELRGFGEYDLVVDGIVFANESEKALEEPFASKFAKTKVSVGDVFEGVGGDIADVCRLVWEEHSGVFGVFAESHLDREQDCDFDGETLLLLGGAFGQLRFIAAYVEHYTALDGF